MCPLVLHGDGWGTCGQMDGGTASSLKLLPCAVVLVTLMGCAHAHINTHELLLVLGSVQRHMAHMCPDTTDDGLCPACSCSPFEGAWEEPRPVLTYIFFCFCRGRRVTEGRG